MRDALGATNVEYTARVAESTLARVHYVLALDPSLPTPELALMTSMPALLRPPAPGIEDFSEAAVAVLGEEAAAPLRGLYERAFSTAYKEDFGVGQAVADLRRLELLTDETSTSFALYKPPQQSESIRRFKVFRCPDLPDPRPAALHRHGARGRRRAAV